MGQADGQPLEAPPLTVDPKLVPPSAFVEHKKQRGKEEAGEDGQAHGHGDLRVGQSGLGLLCVQSPPRQSPTLSRAPKAARSTPGDWAGL